MKMRTHTYRAMQLIIIIMLLSKLNIAAQTQPGFIPQLTPKALEAYGFNLSLIPGPGGKFHISKEFSYRDKQNKIWTALPVNEKNGKRFVTDGASIPKYFWSIYGSPWSGCYKFPAIIHDYYCENQKGLSSEVHKMFYEACLTAGVKPFKASLAYFAVSKFGPYWGKEKEYSSAYGRFKLIFMNFSGNKGVNNSELVILSIPRNQFFKVDKNSKSINSLKGKSSGKNNYRLISMKTKMNMLPDDKTHQNLSDEEKSLEIKAAKRWIEKTKATQEDIDNILSLIREEYKKNEQASTSIQPNSPRKQM